MSRLFLGDNFFAVVVLVDSLQGKHDRPKIAKREGLIGVFLLPLLEVLRKYLACGVGVEGDFELILPDLFANFLSLCPVVIL